MRAYRVLENGNGTVRVERDESFNTSAPLAANELARYDMDADVLPVTPAGVPEKYWAWNGSAIVEASQAVKDAIDALIVAPDPVADADAALAVACPVFAEHPTNVPPAGLMYRLDEGVIKTWWVVRQGDEIATQISAHDAAGQPIIRTRDLRTGTETVIKVGEWIAQMKTFLTAAGADAALAKLTQDAAKAAATKAEAGRVEAVVK